VSGGSRNADDDLKPVISIEYTTPGSALDAQLRREQTQAILDLLAVRRRLADGGGSDI
jgi:hypothetical protein